MASLQKYILHICIRKPLAVCCLLFCLNLVCLNLFMLQFCGSEISKGYDPYYSEDMEDIPKLGEAEKALFMEGHLDILNTGKRLTIHLACLLTDYNFTATETLIKSALMFTTASLHLHLFAPNSTHVKHLVSSMSHWPKVFSTRISHTEYRLDCNYLEQALTSDVLLSLLQSSNDKWKLCLLTSIHLISATNYVIISDSTVLFISDISELWQLFGSFLHSHVVQLAPAGKISSSDETVYPKNGCHPGVILVNLQVYTSSGFVQNFTQTLKSWSKSSLSFQSVLDLHFGHFPDSVGLLPCSWNFHTGMAQCDVKTGEVLCPDAHNGGVKGIHGPKDVIPGTAYAILAKAIAEYNSRYHKTWVYWNKVFTTLTNVQQTQRCKNNVYGLWQAFNLALQRHIMLLSDSL